MRQGHSEADWQIVCDHITFHTLECEEDGIILLDNLEHFARAEAAVLQAQADVIVIDPLRDSHSGELNSDQEMTNATRNLTRLSKVGGRIDRALLVLHHALTGKAGAAKASGYDRASFGRNSKTLHGWARAQINIAPGCPDNSNLLVVTSGKNNNFKEFVTFAIELNPRTMTYVLKPDFNLDAWQAEITGTKRGVKNLGEGQILALLETVGGRMEKKLLIDAAVSRYGRGEKHVRTVIDQMVAEGQFVRRVNEKRAGKPDAVFIEILVVAEEEEAE